jgi:hypothetical protein
MNMNYNAEIEFMTTYMMVYANYRYNKCSLVFASEMLTIPYANMFHHIVITNLFDNASAL